MTLRKARMLSLTGDRNLTLDTMRDVNDEFVGFDVNINDYSAGIIFGELSGVFPPIPMLL